MDEKSIIMFDGVCNLCNGFVSFMIPRDPNNKFQFGSLQSAKIKAILAAHNVSITNISTVILLENNQLYTQSTAVLKIFRKMSWGWPLMYAFIVVPKPIRDFIYDLVAKNRYKLFGKKETCMIPSPELKAKFVE